MVLPLNEETAGIGSLVGFSASLFKACVQGLILLSKARNHERAASGFSLMVDIELYKLHIWGDEVGVARNDPTLMVDARQAERVPRVLDRLHELITDLGKIKAVYGLELEEAEGQPLSQDEAESAFRRLRIQAEIGSQTWLLNTLQQTVVPWKVLQWVTFNELKAPVLLDSIRSLVRRLQQVLDPCRQRKFAKAVDVILRSTVLNTVNEQDLELIGLLGEAAPAEGRVAAAARLKKQGLLLGIVDNRLPPTASRSRTDSLLPLPQRKPSYPPISQLYSYKDLARKRLRPERLQYDDCDVSKNRFLAHYANAPVLVEKRSETGIDKEFQRDRVIKVANFLADLDSSFHGLPCRGYVSFLDQFAYVFDLQGVLKPSPAPSIPQRTSYRSLRSLLDSASSPSLNLRVDFAVRLLETLLQLHTSGWLHKEFRSDNVLFFRDSAEDPGAFLRSKLRVTGYAHARLDRPTEPTEPLQSELEADLYRHPACLRQHRESFQRAFDMFSVGCVLIELGLWRSLSSLCCTLAPKTTKTQPVDYMRLRNKHLFATSNQSKVVVGEVVLQQLNAAAGRRYAEVVKSLLQSWANPADLLEVEVDCLAKLKTMADVLEYD